MLHTGRWHIHGGHVSSISFENRVASMCLWLTLSVLIPWLLWLVQGLGGRVSRLELISVVVRLMVLIGVKLGSVGVLLCLRPAGSKTGRILRTWLVEAFSKLPIIGYECILAARNPSKKVVA